MALAGIGRQTEWLPDPPRWRDRALESALDAVAALEPGIVVAGHKKVDADNGSEIIGQSQQYLGDFSRIVAEETTTAGIVARMVELYPDWENLRTLWHSSRAALARRNS
jgi:hypothetical protein